MTHKRFAALITALMAVLGTAQAQSDFDCPGFRNITEFETYDPNYFWIGRVGWKKDNTFDYDSTDGVNIMSTCIWARDIPADSLMDPKYYSPDTSICHGVNPYSHCNEPEGSFDFSNRRFVIVDQEHAGFDTLTVHNGTGLPRIPPGYSTSIRLGDMYAGGYCRDSTKGAEALFYTMKVTPQNALLLINYAIVTRKFDHSAWDAGEFVIRVVLQNEDGTWPNTPINDSLCYVVCAPHFSGALVAPWRQGLVTGCTEDFCYKPWAKVAINLSNYLFRTVRIEMYTSDCMWQYDCLYAYISGDFQPSNINSSGCPLVTSDVIDTLQAPPGMLSYQWYVSEDAAVDVNDTALLNRTRFRPCLQGVSQKFTPRERDFITSSGDTVAEKTFRCVMTSAMDPRRPFHSSAYANVVNRKPHVQYEYEYECGNVCNLVNTSFSFSNDAMSDSSMWVIYDDTLCRRPIDTLYGLRQRYKFPRSGRFGVILTAHTADLSCGAQDTIQLNIPHHPKASINVLQHNLCDGEEAEVRFHSQYADMMFCKAGTQEVPVESLDTTKYDFLTHLGATPLQCIAANTMGCADTVYDTIYTYGTPALSIDPPDGLICKGRSASITAVGVPTYTWYSNPPDTALASQQGQQTITVSPDTTTTYFIKAVSIPRCAIYNQSVVVEVDPWPVPALRMENPYINFDYPAISIEDISANAHHTHWELSDGYTYTGTVLNRTLPGIAVDAKLDVTMQTCNRANCCKDTNVTIPVKLFSHWFPNVFTPSRDENNRFGVVTSLPLVEYELYVYNRWGLLMFHTTNPAETWDGTHDGTPCQQGTYAYVYRVAFDNNDKTIFTGRGSITLLR